MCKINTNAMQLTNCLASLAGKVSVISMMSCTKLWHISSYQQGRRCCSKYYLEGVAINESRGTIVHAGPETHGGKERQDTSR